MEYLLEDAVGERGALKKKKKYRKEKINRRERGRIMKKRMKIRR